MIMIEEVFNLIGMEFVRIKPGKYLRGNEFQNLEAFWEEVLRQGYEDAIKEWYKREFPRHEVIISSPFFMGTTPITNREFFMFLEETGYIPTSIQGGKHYHWLQQEHRWGNSYITIEDYLANARDRSNNPATGVSWCDANEFIAWLSKKDGRNYSLPTEAQWEYAARDGSKGIFPVDVVDDRWEGSLDDIAWNIRNAENLTHTVKTKLPNSRGIYDILGNVWEWCLDGFREEEYPSLKPFVKDPVGISETVLKSLKGGSYLDYARSLRPADRFGFDMRSGSDDIGFRIIHS